MTSQDNLPFNFTPPPSPKDYTWGRNLLAYLSHCSSTCPLSPEDLAARCGYKKLHKFQYHRVAWDAGEGPIPLAYLQAINVDMDLLQTCVDLDQREFDEAVKVLPLPGYFILRAAGAAYVRRPLPEGMSEEEAVDFVREFATKIKMRCWIPFSGGLKTVWFRPDGSFFTSLNRPELRVEGKKVKTVSFGDVVQAGVMRVK